MQMLSDTHCLFSRRIFDGQSATDQWAALVKSSPKDPEITREHAKLTDRDKSQMNPRRPAAIAGLMLGSPVFRKRTGEKPCQLHRRVFVRKRAQWPWGGEHRRFRRYVKPTAVRALNQRRQQRFKKTNGTRLARRVNFRTWQPPTALNIVDPTPQRARLYLSMRPR